MLVELKGNFFDGRRLWKREPGGTEFPDDYPQKLLPSTAKVLDGPYEAEPETQTEMELGGKPEKEKATDPEPEPENPEPDSKKTDGSKETESLLTSTKSAKGK